MNKNKVIEQNAISDLKMRRKQERITKDQIKEDLREILAANKFRASDILLDRMARYTITSAHSIIWNDEQVRNVLLSYVRQHGAESLIEACLDFIK